MTPTAEDMARDLAADLAEWKRTASEMPEWVGGTMRESDLAKFCRWAYRPAARRALHAEALLAKGVALLRCVTALWMTFGNDSQHAGDCNCVICQAKAFLANAEGGAL